MNNIHPVCVYLGEALGRYGFGDGHPFSPQRYEVFKEAFYQLSLDTQVDILAPVSALQETIELFHDHDYVELVKHKSITGEGHLDCGDTPAFVGVYEAACTVAGTTVDAADRIMRGEYKRAFVPIAGLHHARRHIAAGFCAFNDCGIVIEFLRKQHGIKRIAYIDIDAHHGDGVFYSFEDDPQLIFADMHEDGRYLYPGTGSIEETGKGTAAGTKLNIPMPPHANDNTFMQIWPKLEDFVRRANPEFILLQAGADSIEGDPITHLAYSEASHAHAATRLCRLADATCEGRLLVMGGGGYNLNNIAKTWTAVVEALVECSRPPII
jgi:acetoin utilization protein AcuC